MDLRQCVNGGIRNHDGEVLGLWYDDLKWSFTLAAKLLAIQKGCLVSNNFLGKEIQNESDCKTAIKTLLEINICLWRVISVFQAIRNMLISLEKVDVVWCSRDYSKSAHEAVKWVESVVKSDNSFLSNVSSNVESCILLLMNKYLSL